jgi:hypothetical protein
MISFMLPQIVPVGAHRVANDNNPNFARKTDYWRESQNIDNEPAFSHPVSSRYLLIYTSPYLWTLSTVSVSLVMR